MSILISFFFYPKLVRNLFLINDALNCRGQAEKEFRVEVEAIGHVRHKNLVRLLGYCIEGVQRLAFGSVSLSFCFVDLYSNSEMRRHEIYFQDVGV